MNPEAPNALAYPGLVNVDSEFKADHILGLTVAYWGVL